MPDNRKEFDHRSWEGGTTTISILRGWMVRKGISINATIEYAGCGSHAIMFVWPMNAEETEAWAKLQRDELQRIEDKAAEQRSRGLIA